MNICGTYSRLTLDVHMDAQLDTMELTWVGRHPLSLMCMCGGEKANSKIQSSPILAHTF